MPAPLGNQNAAKGKLWHGAIVRALRKESKSEALEALDELAAQLIAACRAGDLSALKELGDRLDGKPSQSVSVDVGRRAPVDLEDADLAGVIAANSSGGTASAEDGAAGAAGLH